MNDLPANSDAVARKVTVADFFEAGREPLNLNLNVVVGGAGMEREILEPVINRPGLALTGFYDHFAWKRIQVVGVAESAYIASVDDATLRTRLREIYSLGAYCVVYANSIRPTDAAIEMTREAGAVLLSTDMPTRFFVNKCSFVLDRLTAPKTSLYGTMVEVDGVGVMLEGAPGLGKSETALGLIKRGAALVADDLTCIRKEVGNGYLFGSASGSTSGFMEIRGIGLMNVQRVFGVNAVRAEKRLQLIVSFRHLKDVASDIDRLGQTRLKRTILGTDITNVIIPVSEGRDLVNLVETAVQQQKMINAGYDPVGELSERLRHRADERAARRKPSA